MSSAGGEPHDGVESQPSQAGQDEAFDEFVARMVDEGASPSAAQAAAHAHSTLEAHRMRPGTLLPGPTARWWQHAMFVMLGFFLAVLISVVFTAPAFHPTETDAQARNWSVLFLVTLFPVLALFIASGTGMYVKAIREGKKGYTTLRGLDAGQLEIRDARGNAIPPGDKRLSASAKFMHAFGVIGSACAVISPLIWVVRLMIQ